MFWLGLWKPIHGICDDGNDDGTDGTDDDWGCNDDGACNDGGTCNGNGIDAWG